MKKFFQGMLRLPAGVGVAVAALSLGLALPSAAAQMGQPGSGDPAQAAAFGNARMVRGTVTAVTPDHLSVKTEAGDTFDIVLSPNTQVRKGRDPMKAADIHAGDGVGAMGEIDPTKKTVHALFVTIVDAEQLKKAREAMGKTFISGTVTAIDLDNLKLTIKRTDDVLQVIQVDEDTSFRKGGRNMAMALGADGAPGGGARQRNGGAAPANGANEGESVTLADIKVGNVVAGPGALKNGIFVPTQLAISDPGAQRQRRRPDAGAPGSATPPAAPPSSTPPGMGMGA